VGKRKKYATKLRSFGVQKMPHPSMSTTMERGLKSQAPAPLKQYAFANMA
jgi:hypothetical protein